MDQLNQKSPSYEDIWSQLEQVLIALERGLARTGADANRSSDYFFLLFSRLLRHSVLTRPYFEKYGPPQDWSKFFDATRIGGDHPGNASDMVVRGRTIKLPLHPLNLVYRDLVSATLLAHCSDDADAIVEFGSGWSANIFNLWKSGAPLDAAYFGCEPTLAGRALASRLSGWQERRSYRAIPFDYRHPDFTFLPKGCREPLVYTCHSIEQVERLDDRFFDRLLDPLSSAERVTGVHIEPVAWQYGFDAKHFPTPPDWAARGQQEAAWRNQNVNLTSVLCDAESRGILRLKMVELHSITTVPDYPTATIVWTRA
jgi:hypothetical protein